MGAAVGPLMTFLHQRLGIALLLFSIVLGTWGTYQLARRRAVSGGFRSGYLLMIGLLAVQGLAGTAAFVAGYRPHEILHLVYGVFAILFLPGIYFYAERGRDRTREAAFLAGACWIVAIAFGRGLITGRV